MTFKPSKYQSNIFEFIAKGKGNAIIQAVAGSGKTTTIIQATKLIPNNSKAVFVAFNKAIADELKTKLPENIRSSTLHSLGLSMFYGNTNQKPQVDGSKIDLIINQVFSEEQLSEREQSEYFVSVKRTAVMCKQELTNYKNFEELDILTTKYNIDVEITPLFINLVDKVLIKCKKQVSIVDFEDMVWIPIVNNFKTEAFDFVFVDEVQDLNQVQFELIKKICDEHTRVIAVGDRNQSIYAFRGADINSMDNFKDYFKAKEMPLSICYRCPKKVIEKAKKIVSQIECSENAEEGIVDYIECDKILSKAVDGDLVLCRTNAPLIPVAFGLLREGKKAIIRGRDIGSNLIKMINKYKVSNLQDLENRISDFKSLQEEKLNLIEQGKYDKKKKFSLMTVVDSCETILFLANEVETIEELKAKISVIFSDDKIGIICSSVHKAKGLEADNVFIVNYGNMPHPMAKSEDEKQQEMNIKYVAITRAKRELHLIE